MELYTEGVLNLNFTLIFLFSKCWDTIIQYSIYLTFIFLVFLCISRFFFVCVWSRKRFSNARYNRVRCCVVSHIFACAPESCTAALFHYRGWFCLVWGFANWGEAILIFVSWTLTGTNIIWTVKTSKQRNKQTLLATEKQIVTFVQNLIWTFLELK